MPDSVTDQIQSRVASSLAAWRGRVQAWLISDASTRWLLAAILLVAAYLRLSHLNWDQGTHIHPDERFLTMVSDALRLPASLGEFFDSTKSPMSPYNKGYNFFVYGTLPIFIVRVAGEVANEFNQAVQLWVNEGGAPLRLVGYDGIHLVGRALSGLFDLGCVFLAFVIGRRLYGRRVGLLAAALYAFAVLPLQQSHFYTVDTFGSFFGLLTFYFAVRVAQGGEHGRRDGGWESYVGLGASLGASLACRINLAPLAGIAVLAAGIRLWDDWHTLASRLAQNGPADANGRQALWLGALIQATLFRLLLMGIVTIAVFRIAQPYAFGGTSLLDFSLAPKFRDNMLQISQLISGNADYPPGHQWANRTPFVFPFVNMVVWGLGVPLGLAAWAGWALAAFQVVRGLTAVGDRATSWQGDTVTRRQGDTVNEQTLREPDSVTVLPAHPVTVSLTPWRHHLLIVAWIGGMFLWQGLQYVQSMRYLLPIYPHLAIMAAWLLWGAVEWANRRIGESANRQIGETAEPKPVYLPFADRIPASVLRIVRSVFCALYSALRIGYSALRTRQAAYGLLATVTILTMLWGWGFLAIYRRPLSRLTASRWIYANIPPGKVIANEHWDDGLPMRVEGKDGFGSWGYKGLSSSSDGSMQMYMEDTPEKRELLYRWLNEADYLVMSSNRLWGSIPRLPMRYPMTTLYYKLIFSGELGFKQVGHFTSFPTIFGIQFNDTGAEEAFSVYDHPEVYIFEKTPAYSEALARSYFDPIDLERVIQMWPKQVSAAPTALRFTPEEAQIQYAGGAWSALFDEDGLLNRSPLLSVLGWLLLIELLGLVAFPITFVVLRGLADRGYGVSKTLGILLLAWLSWFGPALKLAPFQRWWIALMLGVLIGASAALAWRRRAALLAFVRSRRSLLLTGEVVFLTLFLLFLLIRIGNPDLWHPARGGEKPMDFAYLNAVIRSTIFPPIDPWQSGGFMNYYYFGFVIVGTLVKLIGIAPWVAYNLIVPTLFALTGVGAFAVAFNLADGDRATEFPGEEAPFEGLRIGSLLAGLGGVFFVTIVGNFGTVKLLLDQFAARSTLEAQSTLGVGKLARALDGLLNWLIGKQPLNFPNDWWFWNPSRIIPDTINEMPFFTFTYADLHAHMIALPLTLLALALAVAAARTANSKQPIADSESQTAICNAPSAEASPWRIELHDLLPLLLMGLVVGALRATNTWDFPTYLLVSLAAVGVLEASRRSALLCPAAWDERLAFLLRAAVAVLWRMLILIAVSSVTFYPYTRHYATAYAGLQLWREKTTTLADYITVWGFFLALTIIYLVSEWIVQAREGRRPAWLDNLLPMIITVAAVLMVGGWLFKLNVWLAAVPLMAVAGMLALGRNLPPARRLALLLLGLALAITMGVEVVRQKDDIGRMNTVFKFYMQAWVLFGVATAFGLSAWAARAMTWRPEWRRLAWGVTGVLFAGVMLFPITAAPAKIRDRFSAEASPRGLDGMAYMERAKYFDNNRDLRLDQDKDAILWLLRNVEGSPVILEAQTPEYRWGSRFSIYTGLPTVQGWNWHQKQQRSVVPGTAIDRRVADVRELYDTLDLARAQKLLNTYGVSYIIVGELERAYYNPAGLAKFATLAQQGYLRPVYIGGGVTIYRVLRPGAPVAGSAPAVGVGPRPVPTPTAPSAQPFISPPK